MKTLIALLVVVAFAAPAFAVGYTPNWQKTCTPAEWKALNCDPSATSFDGTDHTCYKDMNDTTPPQTTCCKMTAAPCASGGGMAVKPTGGSGKTAPTSTKKKTPPTKPASAAELPH